MEKNKKLILVIGAIVLIVIVAVVLLLLPKKDKNEVASNETIKHNVVDKLYKEVEKNTQEKYVSKLFGYTSDKDGNITMVVKEGYLENNKVYDLDGKELGDYDEKTLNTLLDKGTEKVYNYTNNNGDYKMEK